MKTNFCEVHSSSKPFLRKALNQALAVAGLLGTLCVMPVFADDSADVSKLLKGGQYAEALTKANAALAQKPRDAQMRFLKGVALTELNKPSEAIAVFARLSEDFPDLPEPHNNLAVLYASSGQFDKARASLDMAMRTNPSYATAFENLGDVNAKIASQAYDKALQLDPRNSAAKSKLTMLTTLGNDSKAASASAKAAPAVKAATPAAPAIPAAAPAVAKLEKAVAPAAAAANAPTAPNTIVAKKFVPTGDYGRGSMPTPRPVEPVVAALPAPAVVAPPVAVAKPAVPTPPVAVASVTPVAKPAPVQAAPASVTKPAIATPPVAVASVTPAVKPAPVQAAPASVTKPAISTPPVVVASVTPTVKPVQAVPVPATVAKPAAPTPPVAVASLTPVAKPAQVLPVPPTVAKPAAATLPVVVAAAATATATKPAQAVPAPVAKPAPVEAPSKAAKALENDKDDVMKVVNAWAKAWSARDVGSYLDFYANDFQTPNGMSHKAWVDERTSRIKGKGRISVNIENPQVTINEKTATVVFRQVYVSDRLRANGRKTLLLVKQGGKWQIKQERANS